MSQVHLYQQCLQIWSLRRASALSNSSFSSPPWLNFKYTKSFLSQRNKRSGGGAMGTTDLGTTDLGPSDLRHVESMSHTPSGAGKINRLNAVILGDSLASEEDDLILPSAKFSQSALISSQQQVWVLLLLPLPWFNLILIIYVFRIFILIWNSVLFGGNVSVWKDVQEVGWGSSWFLVRDCFWILLEGEMEPKWGL